MWQLGYPTASNHFLQWCFCLGDQQRQTLYPRHHLRKPSKIMSHLRRLSFRSPRTRTQRLRAGLESAVPTVLDTALIQPHPELPTPAVLERSAKPKKTHPPLAPLGVPVLSNGIPVPRECIGGTIGAAESVRQTRLGPNSCVLASYKHDVGGCDG